MLNIKFCCTCLVLCNARGNLCLFVFVGVLFVCLFEASFQVHIKLIGKLTIYSCNTPPPVLLAQIGCHLTSIFVEEITTTWKLFGWPEGTISIKGTKCLVWIYAWFNKTLIQMKYCNIYNCANSRHQQFRFRLSYFHIHIYKHILKQENTKQLWWNNREAN